MREAKSTMMIKDASTSLLEANTAAIGKQDRQQPLVQERKSAVSVDSDCLIKLPVDTQVPTTLMEDGTSQNTLISEEASKKFFLINPSAEGLDSKNNLLQALKELGLCGISI